MIPIFDLRDFDCATLPLALQPQMRELFENCSAKGLLDLTVAVVVEASDTEDDALFDLDWSPLVHPIDGTRWPDFDPYWLSLTLRGGWYRFDYLVEGTGFLYVLFIDAENPAFGPMCRERVS